MKKLIILLLAVLLFVSLAACDEKPADTSSDTDDLSVSETGAETESETNSDGISSGSDVLVYLLMAKKEYIKPNPNDEITASYRFGYNEKGQLAYVRNDAEIEPFLTVTYDGNGVLQETIEVKNKSYTVEYEKRTYSNGKLTGIYGINRYDQVIGKTEYEYDEYGGMIKEVTYNVKDAIASEKIYKFTYDENGNCTEKYSYDDGEWKLTFECRFDSDGRVVYKNGCEYVYDEKGNVVRQNYYRGDELFSYTVYEYDEKDRLVSESTEDDGGSYKYEYAYDGSDRLLSKIGEGYEETYAYAENGLILEHKTVRRDDYGKIREEVYTYDDVGNLLSYVVRSDDELTHKIEYEYREMRVPEEYGALCENNAWLIESIG